MSSVFTKSKCVSGSENFLSDLIPQLGNIYCFYSSLKVLILEVEKDVNSLDVSDLGVLCLSRIPSNMVADPPWDLNLSQALWLSSVICSTLSKFFLLKSYSFLLGLSLGIVYPPPALKNLSESLLRQD